MKLNIPERILATQAAFIFKAKQGNFINFKAIRDLISKLVISDEEEKKYELTLSNDPGGNHYTWNPLGYTEEVEIDITDKQKNILIAQLVEMNEKDQLTDDHLSLCEKLVPNPEEVFKPKETTESK